MAWAIDRPVREIWVKAHREFRFCPLTTIIHRNRITFFAPDLPNTNTLLSQKMTGDPRHSLIHKVPTELWKQIFDDLPAKALRNLAMSSLHMAHKTKEHMIQPFADFFLKEIITAPLMHFLNSCYSSDGNYVTLSQAVLKSPALRISITLSDDGHQLRLLEAFLANSFP